MIWLGRTGGFGGAGGSGYPRNPAGIADLQLDPAQVNPPALCACPSPVSARATLNLIGIL